MQENYVENMFSRSSDSIDDLKRDVSNGTVIKELEHPGDHSIIRIIEVIGGQYIYTLSWPSYSEPYFYARSNYLIPELVSDPPRFTYSVANGMIRRSLKGFFSEYVKDGPNEDFTINYGNFNDGEVQFSQIPFVSDDPNIPLLLFHADFIEHTVQYVALADLIKERDIYNVEIMTCPLMPDGNPFLDGRIEYFGEEIHLPRKVGEEEVRRRLDIARKIFWKFYRDLGLPYTPYIAGYLDEESISTVGNILGTGGEGREIAGTNDSDEAVNTVDGTVDVIYEVPGEYAGDIEALEKELAALYEERVRIEGARFKPEDKKRLIEEIQSKIDELENKIAGLKGRKASL